MSTNNVSISFNAKQMDGTIIQLTIRAETWAQAFEQYYSTVDDLKHHNVEPITGSLPVKTTQPEPAAQPTQVADGAAKEKDTHGELRAISIVESTSGGKTYYRVFTPEHTKFCKFGIPLWPDMMEKYNLDPAKVHAIQPYMLGDNVWIEWFSYMSEGKDGKEREVNKIKRFFTREPQEVKEEPVEDIPW